METVNEQIRRLYVDYELSMTRVADMVGLNYNKVRSILLLYGVVRTHGESLSIKLKRDGNPAKGKKRELSPEARAKMSDAAKKTRARYSHLARGTKITSQGYREYTTGLNKERLVHRVLMEEHLGRPLTNTEVVHHIDGDRLNNSIENLTLLNNREHNSMHAKQYYSMRKRRENGRFC